MVESSSCCLALHISPLPNAQSRMSRNSLLKYMCLVLSAPFLLNRLFFHSIGPCDSQSHTLILTVKQVLLVPKQQAASAWISMVMEFSVTPVFLFVLSHTLPQLYWIYLKLLPQALTVYLQTFIKKIGSKLRTPLLEMFRESFQKGILLPSLRGA